jgi:hypothetical protein
MAYENDGKPSATSPEAIEGKRLQDEARAMLAQMGEAMNAIAEAARKADSPEQLRAVEGLMKRAKAEMADRKIEQNLATLSPLQLEAVGAWELGQYRTIGCCGSNRSGKSFVGGTAYCKYLRDDAPDHSEHLIVTTDQRLSAKNQQKMLWENLPRHLFDTEWTGPKNGFGSRNPVVILDHGGRNIVLHIMTQSEFEANFHAFEGLTIETAWVDESISEELYSAIKTRLTLSNDGRVLISAIPGMAWVYDAVYRAKPEDKVWHKLFEPFTNPLMTAEKLAALERAVPPHERDVRLKGVPAMAGALVYVEFRDDIHVIEPSEIPDDLTWYAGLDVGMDHPTVWLLVGVDRDGRYYVTQEYVSRNTPVEDDVANIKGTLGRKTLRSPTYIDPAAFQVTKANQVSVAQQYRNHGLPTMRSRQTSQVGETAQVHQIKELLAHEELFVSTNCPQLIREFHVWKYKRDRQNKAMSKDAFEDKNNDALDALRYCLTMRPMYGREPRKVTVLNV